MIKHGPYWRLVFTPIFFSLILIFFNSNSFQILYSLAQSTVFSRRFFSSITQSVLKSSGGIRWSSFNQGRAFLHSRSGRNLRCASALTSIVHLLLLPLNFCPLLKATSTLLSIVRTSHFILWAPFNRLGTGTSTSWNISQGRHPGIFLSLIRTYSASYWSPILSLIFFISHYKVIAKFFWSCFVALYFLLHVVRR